MTNEIRGAGSQRRENAAPAERRKPAVKANGGGASAGPPGSEGAHRNTLVRPKAKRAAAQSVVARVGLSQRRVCRFVNLDRNTLRYRSRRRDDRGLRTRMREIAERKRRYGCPRIYVRLRREGWRVNHKTGERIYQEDGLSLRRRPRKKITSVPRVALPLPTRPGLWYARDFVHDRLAHGRRFTCLTMIDPCSKEVPVIEVDVSQSSRNCLEIKWGSTPRVRNEETTRSKSPVSAVLTTPHFPSIYRSCNGWLKTNWFRAGFF